MVSIHRGPKSSALSPLLAPSPPGHYLGRQNSPQAGAAGRHLGPGRGLGWSLGIGPLTS